MMPITNDTAVRQWAREGLSKIATPDEGQACIFGDAYLKQIEVLAPNRTEQLLAAASREAAARSPIGARQVYEKSLAMLETGISGPLAVALAQLGRSLVATHPQAAISLFESIEKHQGGAPERPLTRAHPVHGVPIMSKTDGIYNAYIELVPLDTVKKETDKPSGILKVDRPQKYSNSCPTLYGYFPQTHCGDKVAEMSRRATGRDHIKGDGDPLDICVVTERLFTHGDLLVTAIPIGGLRMLDHGEADDKIIAVLPNDASYGDWRHIQDMKPAMVERLRHYFLTYKQAPDAVKHDVEITHVYDRDEALQVIERAQQDYQDHYC